jgi:calcium-dependent protein kinase
LDCNGLINYTEFLGATIDYKNNFKKEQYYEAFRAFDKDGSGSLSYKEITDIIRPQTKEDIDYLKTLIKKWDLNKDGEIDFEEFITGLESGENLEKITVN